MEGPSEGWDLENVSTPDQAVDELERLFQDMQNFLAERDAVEEKVDKRTDETSEQYEERLFAREEWRRDDENLWANTVTGFWRKRIPDVIKPQVAERLQDARYDKLRMFLVDQGLL